MDKETEVKNEKIKSEDTTVKESEEPKETSLGNEVPTSEEPQKTNIFGVEVEEEKVEQAKQEIPQKEIEEPKPVEDERINIDNVSLNGEEKVVYEYKPAKDYGMWPLLIFFLFVGTIIVFLPTIQKILAEYKNSKITVSGGVNNPNPNNKDNDNTNNEEITYYDFNNETTISINKLTLNSFSKNYENNSYYLILTVLNKSNTSYSYNENIYIELYNDNGTLLSRNLLEGEKNINPASSTQVKLLINNQAYSEVTKMVVKTIETDNYPQLNLPENLKEQETLTCTLNNRTMLYTFKDYKLLSIDETLNVLKTTYQDNILYANALAEYRQSSAKRGLLKGVSSSIVDAEDGFTIATKIDSSTISTDDLNTFEEKGFYKKDTEAKVISFEMTGRGFTCK